MQANYRILIRARTLELVCLYNDNMARNIFIVFLVLLGIDLSAQTKLSDIKDIRLVFPVTYISEIQKGNKAQYNDSLSLISAQLIDSIIENYNIDITEKVTY